MSSKEATVVIKRILLMDSHAQASAVVKAIKNRILELNQLASKEGLSDEEQQERTLLNEAFERISSQGKTIPSSVTPANWHDWVTTEETPPFV